MNISQQKVPEKKTQKGQMHWPSHLFVHEYVYKRVDNGGKLGQQRRHDACLWTQKVPGAEGGEQGRHPVWQPADQVADHHYDDHHQHPLLSVTGHYCAHSAHLQDRKHLTAIIGWLKMNSWKFSQISIFNITILTDFFSNGSHLSSEFTVFLSVAVNVCVYTAFPCIYFQ